MIAFWQHMLAWLKAIGKKRPSRAVQPSPEVTRVADRIVAGAVNVIDALGAGLPEIIYENALAHELRKAGLAVSQRQNVGVYYDEAIVGDYSVDLVVAGIVLVDLTVVRRKAFNASESRKYLKATGLTLCLLINFGSARLAVKRVLISR